MRRRFPLDQAASSVERSMSERSIGREEPQARQGCSGNIQLSLIFDFVGIIADPVQEVLLSERNVRIWFGVFDACYEFKSARLPFRIWCLTGSNPVGSRSESGDKWVQIR